MSATLRPASIILLACFAVALCTGCAPKPPLRIGLNFWPGYEFLFLAHELGFFREERVEVQLLEFNSQADARRSFERGQIDGMGTTVAEVVLAGATTRDMLKIVSIVDYSSGGDMILARGEIPSVQSLRGRRVGVELGSICVYVLARALENEGLSMADIVPVPGDQATLEAELRANTLDAIVTYPPTSTLLLRDKVGQTLFNSKQIPREVLDVLAFGEHTLTERPEAVAAVLRAFHRAQAYWATHPEQAGKILAARLRLTPAEVKAALTEDIQLVTARDQAAYLVQGDLLPVLNRTLAVFKQLRLIDEARPVTDYFSPQFAKAP